MKKRPQREEQQMTIYGREMVFFGIIVLMIVILGMTFVSCNSRVVIETQTSLSTELAPRSPE